MKTLTSTTLVRNTCSNGLIQCLMQGLVACCGGQISTGDMEGIFGIGIVREAGMVNREEKR